MSQISPSSAKGSTTYFAQSQTKFACTCLLLQAAVAVLFILLVRYDESAGKMEIKRGKTRLQGLMVAKSEQEENHHEEPFFSYPLILDVHMMLLGGFGLLMCFLRRHGFSSMAMTMLVTTLATEWAVLFAGFARMSQEDGIHIKIGLHDLLEGGLSAAAVLISYGAVLGKVNPFQLVAMTVVETATFVVNSYVGYTVLGVLDVGGSIFVHAFGAYFGLAVSLVLSRRTKNNDDDEDKDNPNESSTVVSDLLSILGTVLLWVFWPSFNAILAADMNAFNRAVINTHVSLVAATVATFIVSSFFGEKKRFDMVDIQNATLSGGVAMGAVADLMVQPYGAFLVGSVAGVVSTLGYKKLQGKLLDRFGLHDTCGVHNLHGLPAVISGVLSAVFCAAASVDAYGERFYSLFPSAAPPDGSKELDELHKSSMSWSEVEGGDGRSMAMQGLWQMVALLGTVVVAVVMGLMTGLVLSVESLFQPLRPHQQFQDEPFWEVPDDYHLGNKSAGDGDEYRDRFHDLGNQREEHESRA